MSIKKICDHCDNEITKEPDYENCHPKGTPSHFNLEITYCFGDRSGKQHVCYDCLWNIVKEVVEEKLKQQPKDKT